MMSVFTWSFSCVFTFVVLPGACLSMCLYFFLRGRRLRAADQGNTGHESNATVLPIDDMLDDLRAALKEHRDNPSAETLDAVWCETRRIGRTCENVTP